MNERELFARVAKDLTTAQRAANIVDNALNRFEDACNRNDFKNAEKLKEVVHSAVDAYMDAIEAAHKRLGL